MPMGRPGTNFQASLHVYEAAKHPFRNGFAG
jgi:hypothetical protein